MKLIVYTLTPNGLTPGYVLDGGYYAVPNGGDSPQDYDIIGLANMFAPEPEIPDVREYLVSIGAEGWQDAEGEPLNLDEAVAFLEGLVQ